MKQLHFYSCVCSPIVHAAQEKRCKVAHASITQAGKKMRSDRADNELEKLAKLSVSSAADVCAAFFAAIDLNGSGA
eukprot:SAG25_NODE_162_length_13200_cov_4.969163_1_plen_75_part_10